MHASLEHSPPTGGSALAGVSIRRVKLVTLALFLAGSLAIYWQALSFSFLNYDDNLFIRDNPHLIQGFNWATVRWAFEANLLSVDRTAEYWMPITLLSRLLDAQLFGMNGGWHHLQGI